MRWLKAGTLGALFVMQHAQAEGTLPSGLPPGFEDIATQAIAMCGDEGRPELPIAGFTQPHDFNGDGTADYLVESSQFRCQPHGELIWGGTAGTTYLIYTSRPDGSFERAFEASGHALQLVDIFDDERAMAIVIFRHGSYCGLSGASSCVSATIWDPIIEEFTGVGLKRLSGSPD